MAIGDLPVGSAPAPVALPHFPSRLHAFVWRNWDLVPLERLATVVGATPQAIRDLGGAMGLRAPAPVSVDQERRSAITIIRRNWQLLPYDQLLALLGWTSDQLAFALREDDFLYIKLGNLKPACAPVRYQPSDDATREREATIARQVRATFAVDQEPAEPLFDFVRQLSAPPEPAATARPVSKLSPRYCYSYFALYGDPLLDPQADPFPDGFLARLAASGVDGVWLQGVLYQLARFPWNPELSREREKRLINLARLVERAGRHGMGIWLYLNEPRAMPLAFFADHPELRGVTEGDHATLCTSVPAVRDYLRDAVASIVRAVPDLAGFFTITASENLTNCWSHHAGANCPRCASRPPATVIAEVNHCIVDGIRRAEGRSRLIAWDWGWRDDWAPEAIRQLPSEASLMSVSEWSIPINRGGIGTTVGEYSISTVGPGPRARRHWAVARERGLRVIAKIQAGNTWELSSVPYIPAVRNVARHAANLQAEGVDGLMLGWTLGGYPSPNLEVVAEIASQAPNAAADPVEPAMRAVAERRFGPAVAPSVVAAWNRCSEAFSEFPYHGGLVYNAPMQYGPANLLWERPTGYRASMVGFPYDDLDAWRQVYPADVFIGQFRKVAEGLTQAGERLRAEVERLAERLTSGQRATVEAELRVMEAAGIHFRSTGHQARFVVARNALAGVESKAVATPLLDELETVLRAELADAVRLHALQTRDSRLGFEASNQYFYVPADLREKAINCQDLLERWLPAQRARWS
ncbi:MAG: hypothetical protein H7A45_05160 [Verrucomicrobiales bacterium]|nr:hypothetical protein [Verrucomicrobiales bacterium]